MRFIILLSRPELFYGILQIGCMSFIAPLLPKEGIVDKFTFGSFFKCRHTDMPGILMENLLDFYPGEGPFNLSNKEVKMG